MVIRVNLPSRGGGKLAESTLGMSAAKSSTSAGPQTQVQRETSKEWSKSGRAATSSTTPSHRHQRPSSSGTGAWGDCGWAGLVVVRARHWSQQAGWLSAPTPCAAARLTAHSYGQASTDAMDRSTTIVRMMSVTVRVVHLL